MDKIRSEDIRLLKIISYILWIKKDKTRSPFKDIWESSGEEKGLYLLSPFYDRVVEAYRSSLYLLSESL